MITGREHRLRTSFVALVVAFVVALSCSAPLIAQGVEDIEVSGFEGHQQEQSNWCWAATSTSVALFYKPASGWTQCLVANGETSRTDCCGTGASGACNVYGFLDTALTRVGHLDHFTGGIATVAQIETEVTFARPLGLRVAWSGGGAHFLCIRGHYTVGGVEYMSVDDPIYGRSEVAYSTLQTAYQGTGSWTHTYFTKY